MQKIAPFLWFDGQAEEAARFYVSIFSGAGRDARVVSVMPGPGGKAMGVTFELAGQLFRALNGGPQFTFNEAVSFFVDCDAGRGGYWAKLSRRKPRNRAAGWTGSVCPGDSVRVGPDVGRQDPAKANRAMQAMLAMSKIDIAALRTAFDGN